MECNVVGQGINHYIVSQSERAAECSPDFVFIQTPLLYNNHSFFFLSLFLGSPTTKIGKVAE
jgi:hypothetical protein